MLDGNVKTVAGTIKHDHHLRFFFETEEVIPFKKHPDDAAWDLKAKEEVEIDCLETVPVATGVSVVIPQGYVGILKSRSGLGIEGINVTAGVIDSNYRGEIKVIMQNIGHSKILLKKHTRIAQIMVVPCMRNAAFEIGKAPLDTDRGSNGFGSTGK